MQAVLQELDNLARNQAQRTANCGYNSCKARFSYHGIWQQNPVEPAHALSHTYQATILQLDNANLHVQVCHTWRPRHLASRAVLKCRVFVVAHLTRAL